MSIRNAVERRLQVSTDGTGTLTKPERIREIATHFGRIMELLGLDMSEDGLRDTPARVAEMYVNEVFSGLDPDNFPRIAVFLNNGYEGMLVERDIAVYSYCEHHFVPIIGRAHVAYFPGEKIIGLSKIHRLVQHFSKRPQVQERLTCQIGEALRDVLGNEDVAVMVEATHLCVSSRGVGDTSSETLTTWFNGRFRLAHEQQAFYNIIKSKSG